MEKEELKAYEISCLNKLNYNLSYYTPFNYLKIFFALGFIFEEDLQLISFDVDSNSDNNQDNNNNVILPYIDNLDDFEIKNKKFSSLDKVYEFSEKIMFITLSNSDILNEFDNFKIACGVIAFTREFLYENNLNKTNDDKNKVKKQEKKYNEEKADMNYSSLVNEEKINKFIWNESLKKIYAIEFDDFQTQYNLIKQ